MRLTSFSVEGYKGFTRRVTLEKLGPLNVIHGANNSGKSNLIEAIGLFFTALRLIYAPSQLRLSYLPATGRKIRRRTVITGISPVGISEQPEAAQRRNTLPAEVLEAAGYPPDEIFCLGGKGVIVIEAELSGLLPSADGATSSEKVAHSSHRIELVRLEKDRVEIRIPGVDAATEGRLQTLTAQPSFSLIHVDRSASESRELNESLEAEPLAPRDLVPADLCRALFDAFEKEDGRWDRFVETLDLFSDLLPGGPMVLFSPQLNRAGLFFKSTTDKRVHSHLLGSGTQQVIALLGRLVTAGSSILAIEEPELNLGFQIQHRLLDALRGLVADVAHEPSQIFLTSHSPAFEVPSPAFFYGLTEKHGSPQLDRRPTSEAEAYTGFRSQARPATEVAPLSYVTKEGVVQLPDRIRDALHIRNGGGVLFDVEPDTGFVRMMTNTQFLALLDESDDGVSK